METKDNFSQNQEDSSGQNLFELPKWLKRVQEESWEAEILLSGLILVSLIQLPQYLIELMHFLGREFTLIGEVYGALSMLGVSIYWLIIGFVIHLSLRGIWIGLVGLSFVFPEGVNKSKINVFVPAFRKEIERDTQMGMQLLRIEKYASTMFSLSFLLFIISIGFAIAFFVVMVGGYYMWHLLGLEDSIVQGAYKIIFQGFGIIYLLDFLSMGILKRIKWFSYIYHPFYRFFSFLTLASFYRSIYYVYVSQIKAWKLLTGFFIFAIVSFLMILLAFVELGPTSWVSQMKYWSNKPTLSQYHGHYSNLAEDKLSRAAHIQSDVITSDHPYIRLFVNHRASDEVFISDWCEMETLEDATSASQLDSLRLDCMGKYYRVQIGDSVFTDIEWLYFQFPKDMQKGIISYLDVSYLPQGRHFLYIYREDETAAPAYVTIAFFKL